MEAFLFSACLIFLFFCTNCNSRNFVQLCFFFLSDTRINFLLQHSFAVVSAARSLACKKVVGEKRAPRADWQLCIGSMCES